MCVGVHGACWLRTKQQLPKKVIEKKCIGIGNGDDRASLNLVMWKNELCELCSIIAWWRSCLTPIMTMERNVWTTASAPTHHRYRRGYSDVMFVSWVFAIERRCSWSLMQNAREGEAPYRRWSNMNLSICVSSFLDLSSVFWYLMQCELSTRCPCCQDPQQYLNIKCSVEWQASKRECPYLR